MSPRSSDGPLAEPTRAVELVDEATLPESPDEHWPESSEAGEERPVEPSRTVVHLPEESEDDPGTYFDPEDEDSAPTGPLDSTWAERTADEDLEEFPDDGLLEPEH
ncbi:MAG: hypothetical protein VX899_24785 [Myxococcota bacterium]|nr:hypothetical protein [Myxococcota bacterium]